MMPVAVDNESLLHLADNFDLSLLPQETPKICNKPIMNRSKNHIEYQAPFTNGNTVPLTPPDIKLEDFCYWSECHPSEVNDAIVKLEGNDQSITYHHSLNDFNKVMLLPPPPYPGASVSNYSAINSLANDNCTEVLPSTIPITAAPIKREQFHILPPSPPESNCCGTPSPMSCISLHPLEIKTEPSFEYHTAETQVLVSDNTSRAILTESDEEICTGDIEPVISMALEQVRREAELTCARLQMSTGEPEPIPDLINLIREIIILINLYF